MINILEYNYRLNYKTNVKYARSRVGDYRLDLAEEAVQEAYYRAIKYIDSCTNEAEFINWFSRILINCINDIKNDERDRGVSYNDEIEVVSNTPVNYSVEITDLINKEKPRDKEILTMYFLYDFKSKEISEFLIVNHDVVRDVIRRFRKRVNSE